jgi:CheY-like chemotaxis protein
MGKKTVLITDDVEVNRVILREILKDEFDLLEAAAMGWRQWNVIHQKRVTIFLPYCWMSLCRIWMDLRVLRMHGIRESCWIGSQYC